MDILLMIIYCTFLLGLLVVVHEAGHYFVARAFGIRVSEFMIGLPGPNIGFRWHGTKFGLTAVPLGGYARVCGMEPGEESPYIRDVLASVYGRGTLNMEDVALEVGITDDQAYEALEELVEWGSIIGPRKKDAYNTYRTPQVSASKNVDASGEGQARPVADPQAFYESERSKQYRSLPFWKRTMILIAGPLMNLILAILVFLIVFSLVGVDVQSQSTGEMVHVTVDPLKSIAIGFNYIGMVFMAILQLFNPQTAAETVSNSTSIVGVAVLSKDAADQGPVVFSMFIAMISVSLGLMNMLPIPPLDGGRFVVEIYQRIRRKSISIQALNALSFLGIAFFTLFFFFMLNQDVQRFVFGNWG